MSPGSEQDRLLQHDYDGIQEYDNPMPRWWLWILIGSVIWAVLYWFNVPGIGSGKGRIANYEHDMAAAREKYGDLSAPKPVEFSDAGLFAAAHDPATIAKGKAQFEQTCTPCHMSDMGGSIGPNLTDDFWIHGNAPTQIANTISNGVLEKGMPAWNQTLAPDAIEAVAAYVMSMHGTKPAAPKEPQGDEMEPWEPGESAEHH